MQLLHICKVLISTHRWLTFSLHPDRVLLFPLTCRDTTKHCPLRYQLGRGFICPFCYVGMSHILPAEGVLPLCQGWQGAQFLSRSFCVLSENFCCSSSSIECIITCFKPIEATFAVTILSHVQFIVIPDITCHKILYVHSVNLNLLYHKKNAQGIWSDGHTKQDWFLA